MTFKPGAELDPGQVTDVRGRSYGGGRGLAVGGGGIGLVIAIVYLLLGGDPGALINQAPAGGAVEPNSSALARPISRPRRSSTAMGSTRAAAPRPRP